MTKSEKLFEMLELIREYPGLTVRDLARLCGVSERGVYRYINTLAKADISVRFQGGGYTLQEEDYSDIFRKSDPEGMEALKDLMSLGMQNCEDERLLAYGEEFISQIEANLPKKGKRQTSRIQVVPGGVAATQPGGTITIGHSSKPDIINPILTSETISVSLTNLIFSGLIKLDSENRPVPDAAESWRVSDDGLTWTFFIRDGVQFHDGEPLTAYDAEFTYKAIMDPKNGSPVARRYNMVKNFEAQDARKFRATLKYPFAPIIYRMGWSIVPEHLLKDADLHTTSFNRRPVGSGPFKLVDWSEDDAITLDANRNYFIKGRPVLDRLVFKSYPDREAAMQAISSGDIDMAMNLTASDLTFMSKQGAFRTYPTSTAPYFAVILNLNDPLFRDIRVRKALDHAVDRDSIIRKQLKGYSKICTGPFGVDSWAYNPDVQPTPYDVGKAADLLKQAGWQDTDGDGILDKDGKPLKILLIVPEISDSLERIAVAVRAQLVKVGIRVEIVYKDILKITGSAFQALLFRLNVGMDPDSASRHWHSKHCDTDLFSYRNEIVDELLELGRQTGKLEERRAIYHKIHRIIHDDCPAIFLASACEFIGSSYPFGNTRFPSLLYFLTTMKDWQIVSEETERAVRKSRISATS